MNNQFIEGQEVVCVSQDFPLIKEYGGTGEQAKDTPKKGEFLIVDEILGDFLRFDKYDTNESYNWWKSDRFVPKDKFSISDCVTVSNTVKIQ